MILCASTTLFGNTDPDATTAANGGKDPRIGVLLVIIGCLAQGVQYVFEEKVMNVNNAPPLVVIGCEGLWGTILTAIFVYPMAYYLPGQDVGNTFENPYDALALMQNSTLIQYFLVVFVVFVTIYNCAAVYVTKYLSAIWHAILDNFRPITIWGLGLLIHRLGSQYGEVWTAGSWLQLAGLLVLLFGTAVYNGSIWTFDSASDYTPLSSQDGDSQPKKGDLIQTSMAMASPSLTRSPLIYKQLREDMEKENRKEQEMIGKKNAGGGRGYQSLGGRNEV